LTRDEALAFAERWIRSWNQRDLNVILGHYADDVRFRSPRAARLIGTPTIEGKAALASYWRTALERNTSLRFALDHIVWDGEAAELLIVYIADINDHPMRACETFRFDPAGRVVEGEAMHGIAAA
jgi:ketosteroid isomerase-like protein